MKRVMTIQDISCIGKCSLTVALPILSAMGLEAAIVPTAVLSAHTQFSGVHFRDLTEDLEPIRRHWDREGFRFEAIYTGYLGNRRQIALIKDFFRTFAGRTGHSANADPSATVFPKAGAQPDSALHTLRIVDPAMADGGRLYTGFDNAFVREMRELCGEADAILPNLSEAALLTDRPYPGEDASETEVRDLLMRLSEFGSRFCVVTGVTLEDGRFGFLGYDRESGALFRYGKEKVPYRSHGTGDIFASTFTGALVRGQGRIERTKDAVYRALCIAADYTSACIRNTYNDPERVSYGVNFEAELPYLIRRLEEG